ncbi:hypothetical protein SAMN05428949_0812 [Chitinophaga sp. YR627]|uniref:hypothetical protein n=1 Tax=Chitinophaga sp. YR627 TaxID=1881041 RepID=UPI0008EC75DA|nr:hypothetical protein [Chitinophaga sp. YR627]SFM79325.1 hypothetical protein SAMN05428949_0812 [Chitinophaga sp. YR627]
MKKARIALAAIAIFAVAGGTLAFKSRALDFVYVAGANGQFTSKLYGYTFAPGQTTVTGRATTISTTATTIPTTTYYVGN